MNPLNRSIAYFLSKIPPVIGRPLVAPVARNYIAGSRLPEAITTVIKLNGQGLAATIDYLGERVGNASQINAVAGEYERIMKTVYVYGLDANISVKPTSFGLLIDKERCLSALRKIVKLAADRGNSVRLDMEDRAVTEDTIWLYLKLRGEFGRSVGIAIQAYLRRTLGDLDRLLSVSGGNIRLCKGIYNEPRAIAYKQADIIRENYLHALEKIMRSGCYVGIATHDEKLCWGAERLIEKLRLKKYKYEFQMLLGVDEELRRLIAGRGHRLRVYVPYGKDWYRYSIRRLKENPQIAGHVIKQLFSKKK